MPAGAKVILVPPETISSCDFSVRMAHECSEGMATAYLYRTECTVLEVKPAGVYLGHCTACNRYFFSVLPYAR
jgi:hypothetical protein